MQTNIIMAGVGGQGILTIAKGISAAAVARNMHVKQAEVHGMSQRGGAVQSHLRIGDKPIASDLIPAGRADLLISIEPLEALRYVHMMSPDGVVVASANAFVNIGNYPAVEQVLDRITAIPRHVVIDAERLAKLAGASRASNIVLLGAASLFLPFAEAELDASIAEMFADKGDKVVEVNRRALTLGRRAAAAYVKGLDKGGTSRAVRQWLDGLTLEQLLGGDPTLEFDPGAADDRLSGAEAHAVERMLEEVYQSERRQLYEHEVYQIVQLIGAISPPHHVFLPVDNLLSEEALAKFPGEQVVLKIVSPDVVHKSDAKGLVFCAKRPETVEREINGLITLHRSRGARVDGVLVVEFVDRGGQGMGEELFVGIRATREFGPVIAAGLGGVDTEYLAKALRPGLSIAKAVATETTAEEFFESFRNTVAYEMISGQVRGHRRIVSDGELLRCFRAFIALACRFCVDRGEAGPDVAELEVNPFAFRRQHLIPLDGRGRLATATTRPSPRSLDRVRAMLEPKSIAVLGVSSKDRNFGRIILNNIIECGFDKQNLRIVKDGAAEIDGIRCVPRISDLPGETDLLVVAAGASQLPEVVHNCAESGRVGALIVIPGGAGETHASRDVPAQLRDTLSHARTRPGGGPVLLGPNCLGVQSRPGKYDTFFIPTEKLPKRREHPARGVALISQSGAFVITRMSNIETLDPMFAVTLGNQADLTVSDLVAVIGERPDIHTIGVYVEGFNDLDGLDLIRTVRSATNRGCEIVFYKAGRTATGRDAAAGHTASVAGDYDICEAGLTSAGAIVAQSFAEFEQLVELSAAARSKAVNGVRVGAISNAGFETVGIADSLPTGSMAALPSDVVDQISAMLAREGLTALVNVRNPLDLTPMASERAYESAAASMLACDEIDAVLVSAVPLTPALATTADELLERESLAEVLARVAAASSKPLVAVVDSGTAYAPLVRRLRERQIAVFGRADEAARVLGRYLLWKRGR
ncbi:MAG: indolepyruvate oxidoreductase subunit beta [Phycisphaerales bacterium]